MPKTNRKCLDAIEESLQREEKWRKEAKKILEAYKMETDRGQNQSQKRFNILQANTQILGSALFSNTPRPVIRPRWGKGKSKDPLESAICLILERAIMYFLDPNVGRKEFSEELRGQIGIDYLLLGRMVTRVKYSPQVEEEPSKKMPLEDTEEAEIETSSPKQYQYSGEKGKSNPRDSTGADALSIKYQDISIEPWDWEDYCHGEGRSWKEVRWQAFRHWMTDEDLNDNFDGLEKRRFASNKGEVNSQKDGYQKDRTGVWELWDKDDRKIKWCLSEADDYARVDDDPIEIPGFFPNPQPILSVLSDDLVPIPEYRIYRALAEELECIQGRISEITRAIKVGGLYSAQIPEFERVFAVTDGQYLETQNITAIRDAGGLKEAIWSLPIRELIESLISLSQHRESLKGLIYELTGISDILRSSSDPGETLGAQQMKMRNSAMRVQPRQNAIAGYSREIVRIIVAVIAQKFEAHVLEAITGVDLKSDYPGVTWDMIIQVMRGDLLLSYKIDIETDSTIQDIMVSDRQEVREMLTGIVEYITAMAPAVQSGLIPLQSAKDMLLAVIRRYQAGPELEDSINSIGTEQEGGL